MTKDLLTINDKTVHGKVVGMMFDGTERMVFIQKGSLTTLVPATLTSIRIKNNPKKK